MYVYGCRGDQSTHSNIELYGLMYVNKKKNLHHWNSGVRPHAGIHTWPVWEPSQLDAHKNLRASSPFLWLRCLPAVREQTERRVPLCSALLWSGEGRRMKAELPSSGPVRAARASTRSNWTESETLRQVCVCMCEWVRVCGAGNRVEIKDDTSGLIALAVWFNF